jgi:hypothetical protein
VDWGSPFAEVVAAVADLPEENPPDDAAAAGADPPPEENPPEDLTAGAVVLAVVDVPPEENPPELLACECPEKKLVCDELPLELWLEWPLEKPCEELLAQTSDGASASMARQTATATVCGRISNFIFPPDFEPSLGVDPLRKAPSARATCPPPERGTQPQSGDVFMSARKLSWRGRYRHHGARYGGTCNRFRAKRSIDSHRPPVMRVSSTSVTALMTPHPGPSNETMRRLSALLCFLATIFTTTAVAAANRKSEAPSSDTIVRSLTNATQAQVRARLGEPDVARTEGAGAFWTYRSADCALFVFFRKDVKGLRVSGISSGPRRRGDGTIDADACVASAEAAKTLADPPTDP